MKYDEIIDDLFKNGGLGNSPEKFNESKFGEELWKKFKELGFPFTWLAPNVKLIKYEKVLANIDFLLENEVSAMAVSAMALENKTELTVEDIDEHLELIGKVREHMDSRRDMRKLLGAVAGENVSEDVLNYAQKKGFYVIVQTGDSVAIAQMPQGFKARKW
ncbi:MAG: hypothetical protein FWC47_10880 [Oscillospiraceae bacterium]|nr:hypothetical protein [Oscillospiraceae bacterium]